MAPGDFARLPREQRARLEALGRVRGEEQQHRSALAAAKGRPAKGRGK